MGVDDTPGARGGPTRVRVKVGVPRARLLPRRAPRTGSRSAASTFGEVPSGFVGWELWVSLGR